MFALLDCYEYGTNIDTTILRNDKCPRAIFILRSGCSTTLDTINAVLLIIFHLHMDSQFLFLVRSFKRSAIYYSRSCSFKRNRAFMTDDIINVCGLLFSSLLIQDIFSCLLIIFFNYDILICATFNFPSGKI